MSDWNPNLVWVVATVSVECALAAFVLLELRAVLPRSSTRRAGIKIEAHGTHAVDNLIVECRWRTTISVTNRSRRPRPVPVFASRATVTAGRNVYLAAVFLERDLLELNPNEVLIVQVDCLLAAGLTPRNVELAELRAGRESRQLRLRPARQHIGTKWASIWV